MLLRTLGSIFAVILIAMVITTIADAQAPSKKAPTVHNLDSNTVPAILAGNPNMLQQQADTIILSTGEIIHRFDDADRQNVCYIVNSVAIHCVPTNRRR